MYLLQCLTLTTRKFNCTQYSNQENYYHTKTYYMYYLIYFCKYQIFLIHV